VTTFQVSFSAIATGQKSVLTSRQGRKLDDYQVSGLGGCKVVPLTRIFVGGKFKRVNKLGHIKCEGL
jgi:hypothetical protein